MNTANVDAYLRDGCGRCARYRTPACKVHLWTDALEALRALLLESDLVEELKWGSPCYTLDGANVVMLLSLKDCCALSFLKGAALEDDAGLLAPPGPNSRWARVLRFHSLEEVVAGRAHAARLVEQAIALERSGRRVAPSDPAEPVPVELERRLHEDPDLLRAFEELTPGRQRSHILHVAGARQEATRTRRVEQCVPRILAGRGWHDR